MIDETILPDASYYQVHRIEPIYQHLVHRFFHYVVCAAGF